MKFNLEHELVWVSPLDVMIEKEAWKSISASRKFLISFKFPAEIACNWMFWCIEKFVLSAEAHHNKSNLAAYLKLQPINW